MIYPNKQYEIALLAGVVLQFKRLMTDLSELEILKRPCSITLWVFRHM